ncbi:30S ribosomal protein S4 [Patescibacteria group bacterium]|nr:30S ribosomal protein S4 [Patescibacteria group bacterium]MBU1868686.1 30S ribosomal protein S4 [Patescibacteria group bacterium]
MARYTGPKCKLCRREGKKLFLKGKKCDLVKCLIEKKGAVPPGELPKRRRPRVTDYGRRLREKQRIKRTYGVLESQFRRYLSEVDRSDGDFGLSLMRLLESRLDNVIRRLGYTWSLNTARQLVRHGHILVNGEKVDIPSYNIKEGQVISLTPEARKLLIVQQALSEIPTEDIPSWLVRKGDVGKVGRLPDKDDFAEDFDFGLILEFYSR